MRCPLPLSAVRRLVTGARVQGDAGTIPTCSNYACYIIASVRRLNCSEQGVHLAAVPWARRCSALNLLSERAGLTLVRERPVLAAQPGWGASLIHARSTSRSTTWARPLRAST